MTPNPFKRYQSGLTMEDIFPTRTDGTCGCGCGVPLSGRKTRWASGACLTKSLQLFWIVKGDGKRIRKALNERDKGICVSCGHKGPWQADHILPVHRGGGACDLDNFQTLCNACHETKSVNETKERTNQLTSMTMKNDIIVRDIIAEGAGI